MSIEQASFWLGIIGLAQFLPLFLLTLVAGYVADRVDRRWIVRIRSRWRLLCAADARLLVWLGAMTLAPLFAVAVLLGIGRAFAGPALGSIAPNLVPPALAAERDRLEFDRLAGGRDRRPRCSAARLMRCRSACPMRRSAILFAFSLSCMLMIRPIPRGNAGDSRPLRAVIEGLAYVRDNKIVLGAISLDLFAVLLGGATAMLPVFARDILHVGSEGLGALRAAPAVGAALTALMFAWQPMKHHVGVKMFACVAIFGVATMVFGAEPVDVALARRLVLLGSSDMVSVYVRHSLIQLHTPDAMRGRVSAVSGLFISASNEFGEFRAGLAGAAFGPMLAVVGGGGERSLVTGFCAWASRASQGRPFVPPRSPRSTADAPGKDMPDRRGPSLAARLQSPRPRRDERPAAYSDRLLLAEPLLLVARRLRHRRVDDDGDLADPDRAARPQRLRTRIALEPGDGHERHFQSRGIEAAYRLADREHELGGMVMLAAVPSAPLRTARKCRPGSAGWA